MGGGNRFPSSDPFCSSTYIKKSFSSSGTSTSLDQFPAALNAKGIGQRHDNLHCSWSTRFINGAFSGETCDVTSAYKNTVNTSVSHARICLRLYAHLRAHGLLVLTITTTTYIFGPGLRCTQCAKCAVHIGAKAIGTPPEDAWRFMKKYHRRFIDLACAGTVWSPLTLNDQIILVKNLHLGTIG